MQQPLPMFKLRPQPRRRAMPPTRALSSAPNPQLGPHPKLGNMTLHACTREGASIPGAAAKPNCAARLARLPVASRADLRLRAVCRPSSVAPSPLRRCRRRLSRPPCLPASREGERLPARAQRRRCNPKAQGLYALKSTCGRSTNVDPSMVPTLDGHWTQFRYI